MRSVMAICLFLFFSCERNEELMEKEFGLVSENEQTLSGSGKAVQVAERAEIK